MKRSADINFSKNESPSKQSKRALGRSCIGRHKKTRSKHSSVVVDPKKGTAVQYVSPEDGHAIRPIENLQFSANGVTANTPDGKTELRSRRQVNLSTLTTPSKTLYFLSPLKQNTPTKPNRQRVGNTNVANKLKPVPFEWGKLQEDLDLIPKEMRKTATLKPTDKRQSRKKAGTQKKIKTKSSRDIFQDFLDEYRDEMTDDVIAFFEHIINDIPLELSHLIGVSVAPEDFDLKDGGNLVASTCLENTGQNTMEKVASFLKLRGYTSHMDVKAQCFSIHSTGHEIAHTVKYEIKKPATANTSEVTASASYPAFDPQQISTASDALHLGLTMDRMSRGKPKHSFKF